MQKLLLIIDIEATCWPPGSPERARQAEIAEVIEIGAVLTNTLLLEATQPPPGFETFIKPVHHPQLTPFCEELTGIKSEELLHAKSLSQGLESLWCWIEEQSAIVRSDWQITLASWGSFDRGILKRQAKEHDLWLPAWDHIDIKHCFERWSRRHRREGARFGLRRALDEYQLPHQGPAHRALSDALAAWQLWSYIHSPSQLSPIAFDLLSILIDRLKPSQSQVPLLWHKKLSVPFQNNKPNFERASIELLDAQLIDVLEHGKGYVLSTRTLELLALHPTLFQSSN